MAGHGNIEPAKLLEAILTRLPVAVVVHDRDLKVVRVNEAFHRLTGHGKEALGKTPFEIIPEPILSELGLKEKLSRVRDEGAVIGPEEIRYQTPDGRTVIFEHQAFPLVGPDGGVESVVVLLQDLTERVQVARAMKEARERLQEDAATRKAMLFMLEDLNEKNDNLRQAKKEWEAAFGAVTDPLLIHDEAFKIVRANRAYEQAAGAPLREIIGRPYFEVFPKMDGPFKQCQRAIELQEEEEEEEEEEEVFVPVLNRTFRVRFYPFLGGVREARHFSVHVMEDITERKRAEQALQESEEKFRSIAGAAQDAVIMLDNDGRISYWNPAAERILDRTAAEAMGKDAHLWLAPARFHADYERGFRQFRETGQGPVIGKTLELSALRPDGTEFPVELSVAAIQVNGKWNAVGIMRDISQRKEMETQAVRLERLVALGQLLGGIAHELKNPLFVLTGYLQIVREKLAQRQYETLAEDCQKVQDTAQRLTGITERFLRLASPVTGQQQRCSVPAILQDVLGLARNELAQNRIDVSAVYAPDLPETWLDAGQVRETFLNLILNAIQAMAEAHGRGMLTVTATLVAVSGDEGRGEGATRGRGDTEWEKRHGDAESAASPRLPVTAPAAEGGWIEVRIQDDGPGIPSDLRTKIFEPFFTTKPAGKGAGLGLWIVRSNLMMLRGTVRVETEEGRGTIVIVRLPVVASPPQPTVLPPSGPVRG